MSAAMSVSETSGRRPHERRAGQDGPAGASKTTMLKWIDIFETGNAEIDSLHRELIKDCNGLLTLLADEAAWPSIVAQAGKLVVDCIEHFRVEQSVLERIKFPRRDEHVAEHTRIEERLRMLLARMESVDGSLKEHRDLPASLGPSLVDLMIRHDLDYRSHLLYRQGR